MFKLIVLAFAALLAMVAAKPGLIATGYAAAPALSYSSTYQTHGSPLAYTGYYPAGYSTYNGYAGALAYNQYGYRYGSPYNYYL